MPIQITERDDKAIECVFEDGKKTTYYPGWQLFIDAHDIQEAAELEHDSEQGPVVKRFLTGTAALQDRDVSIIGEPEKKTRTLRLGIFDREIPVKKDEDAFMLHSPLGFANLGFNRADWEIGTDDQWHVSLYLPKAAFDLLLGLVAEGKLVSMRLILRLAIYTMNHPMAPTGRSESLFLRPADPDDSFDWPKTADGHVVNVVVTKTKFDLIPTKPDPYAHEEQEGTEMPLPARAPVDPVAASIAALTENMEKLRTTMKWGVGIIAVVLLFLVGK